MGPAGEANAPGGDGRIPFTGTSAWEARARQRRGRQAGQDAELGELVVAPGQHGAVRLGRRRRGNRQAGHTYREHGGQPVFRGRPYGVSRPGSAVPVLPVSR